MNVHSSVHEALLTHDDSVKSWIMHPFLRGNVGPTPGTADNIDTPWYSLQHAMNVLCVTIKPAAADMTTRQVARFRRDYMQHGYGPYVRSRRVFGLVMNFSECSKLQFVQMLVKMNELRPIMQELKMWTRNYVAGTGIVTPRGIGRETQDSTKEKMQDSTHRDRFFMDMGKAVEWLLDELTSYIDVRTKQGFPANFGLASPCTDVDKKLAPQLPEKLDLVLEEEA